MKQLFAGLVSVWLPVAHADVAPVWTAEVIETIDVAELRGTGVVGFAADRALMVAGDDVQAGLAVTVAMAFDEAPVTSQFGEPRWDAATRFDTVLASSGKGVLVSGFERVGTDDERAFSAAIDASGQQLWALPGPVDEAVLLPGDRVLLAASAVLTMRRYSTGQTLWIRNLLELDSVAVDGRVQLSYTAESLLVSYGSRPEVGAPYRRPRLLALDPDTGQTTHDLTSISGLALQDTPFGIDELGGDLVIPWTITDASGNPGLLIERRDPATGVVSWATELSNLPASGRQTGLLVDPGAVQLVVHAAAQAEVLSLDSETGALRFRQSRSASSPPQLSAADAGDLVLARLEGGSVIVERLLGATGQAIWQTEWLTMGAHAVALAPSGHTLDVAAAVHEGPLLALKRARLDPTTGNSVDESSEVPWLRRAALGASAVIAGQPYLAVSELGANKAAIELRRFQAETGEWLATTHLQLSESPELVNRLRILDGGAGDVMVEVVYSMPGGTARRTVVLFRIDATGAVVHSLQIAVNEAGLPRLVASPDGNFSWGYIRCGTAPECTLVAFVVSRHDRLGNLMWQDTANANLLTVIGSDTFYSDFSDEEVQLRTHTGEVFWRSPRVGNFGPFHITPLADDGVVMASTETHPAPLPGRRVLIQNFDLAGGDEHWSDILAIDDDTYVGGPHVWTAETDQRLWVSGNVRPATSDGSHPVSPFLASYDPDSGQRLLFQTLARGADAYWWFQDAVLQQGGWFWMRADRNLQPAFSALSRRRVLTRIDPADGSIAAEHLLYRDFNPAISGKGTLRLLEVAANGDVYIERRAHGEGSIRRIALERLPAPALTSGDVQIELVDEAPFAGIGPSRPLRLRVSNVGSVPATVEVSGHAPASDVGILFTRCEAAAGLVSCPEPVSPDRLPLQLTPGSIAELTTEVWPTHFQPQSASASSAVVFVADLPFSAGDQNLGNNLISVEVRLGGFGDGFE